jgi:hypothetical protein
MTTAIQIPPDSRFSYGSIRWRTPQQGGQSRQYDLTVDLQKHRATLEEQVFGPYGKTVTSHHVDRFDMEHSADALTEFERAVTQVATTDALHTRQASQGVTALNEARNNRLEPIDPNTLQSFFAWSKPDGDLGPWQYRSMRLSGSSPALQPTLDAAHHFVDATYGARIRSHHAGS